MVLYLCQFPWQSSKYIQGLSAERKWLDTNMKRTNVGKRAEDKVLRQTRGVFALSLPSVWYCCQNVLNVSLFLGSTLWVLGLEMLRLQKMWIWEKYIFKRSTLCCLWRKCEVKTQRLFSNSERCRPYSISFSFFYLLLQHNWIYELLSLLRSGYHLYFWITETKTG